MFQCFPNVIYVCVSVWKTMWRFCACNDCSNNVQTWFLFFSLAKSFFRAGKCFQKGTRCLCWYPYHPERISLVISSLGKQGSEWGSRFRPPQPRQSLRLGKGSFSSQNFFLMFSKGPIVEPLAFLLVHLVLMMLVHNWKTGERQGTLAAFSIGPGKRFLA